MCECGFHESLTGDLSNHFMPEVKVCNVCKGLAPFVRQQEAADEKFRASLGDKPDPLKARPSDGRRTFTRMLSEAEKEQRQASRSRGQAARR